MSEIKASARPGLHVQLSPLVFGSIIAGIASTIAVVAFAAMSMHSPGRPPAGQPPPPPPDTTGLTISVGICVIAWVAVLVSLCRDQILARLATLREELTTLTDEYGERRETDGYLHAMRSAGLSSAEVRSLRRVPPPTTSPE